MGFQSWGLVTLRAIVASGHDVVLVVTHPSDLEEYSASFRESVKEFAIARGIPTIESRTAKDATVIGRILQEKADVIVASNWRRYIPMELLHKLPHGGINVHRSLLPLYGGLAPINWAIVDGAVESGVTIHMLADDFDLGDVLLQERFSIGPDETATDVFHKTTPLVTRMVPEVLCQLDTGVVKRVPQDPRAATFFHSRTERENRIDWHRPRSAVYNLIRAQSDPFPNAFTNFGTTRVLVKSALMADHCYRGTPGRIVRRTSEGVVVLCGDEGRGNQGLLLRTVAGPNGDPIPAAVFFEKGDGYLGPV
jgi:methionyl-tRNA formyltransferase